MHMESHLKTVKCNRMCYVNIWKKKQHLFNAAPCIHDMKQPLTTSGQGLAKALESRTCNLNDANTASL